jgi:hypothetical protein
LVRFEVLFGIYEAIQRVVVGREAAARHDAEDMRMVLHRLKEAAAASLC